MSSFAIARGMSQIEKAPCRRLHSGNEFHHRHENHFGSSGNHLGSPGNHFRTSGNHFRPYEDHFATSEAPVGALGSQLRAGEAWRRACDVGLDDAVRPTPRAPRSVGLRVAGAVGPLRGIAPWGHSLRTTVTSAVGELSVSPTSPSVPLPTLGGMGQPSAHHSLVRI